MTSPSIRFGHGPRFRYALETNGHIVQRMSFVDTTPRMARFWKRLFGSYKSGGFAQQEWMDKLASAFSDEVRASFVWATNNRADPVTKRPWEARKAHLDQKLRYGNPPNTYWKVEEDEEATLVRTGALLNRKPFTQETVIGNKIVIDAQTTVPYAWVHQVGATVAHPGSALGQRFWWRTEGKEARRSFTKAHAIRVPRRPFMGLDRAARRRLKQVLLAESRGEP